MSEPKLVSPLLDNFVMGDPISDHHGVRCCPAMTKDADKRYIVKIISIPASQVQLEALLLAGAYSSQASALAYFRELASGVAEEAEILKKLSRFEGFVPYEGLQVVPMEGKVGYDVYLLGTYKRSLERYMRKNSMTHLNAVNLGLDLCASMVMCRRAGFLYVDIKPGNIFINEKNEYRIGDLGFVRLNGLKYASLPDKYRSAYTPPELSDAMAALNETMDTYAIGMVLYQVYNDGKLPAVSEDGNAVPAPIYADYEMAEIILKAIAPDPKDRWEDPMQMGQALVAYMQRNSVNDVPIVPLPEAASQTAAPANPEPSAAEPEVITTEEPAVESQTSTEEASGESVTQEPETPPETPEDTADVIPNDEIVDDPVPAEEKGSDDPSDLSFMDELASDDTTPDENTSGEITYSELSEDTSDILAQADELIAHETPEPVVAPEPIDIPMPAAIVPAEEPAEQTEDTDAAAVQPNDEPTINGETEPTGDVDDIEAHAEVSETAESDPDDADSQPEEDAYEPEKPKRKGRGALIAAILVIILLLGGLAGGYYYYNNYYLQTVDSLEVLGEENRLTVSISTDIDESLLTIHCTDSYGIARHEPVVNGTASFENLNPDTIYKISVTIDGFHELRGEISGSYTTPAQTNIVQFDAIAGSEDGSVMLHFTVDGKDSDSWTVIYTAEGENEQSITFSGHIVTINGLAIGKEYTFRLTSSDPLYIVGNDTVTFSSTALVYAQNLTITGCNENGITAVWTAPEGSSVGTWTVRCYSDNGYDETLETTELNATFTDIDPTQAYTVEVIAEGMSVGTRTYVTANSATITGYSAETTALRLTASWEYTGTAPEAGWLVLYRMEGSDQEQVIRTTENSVSIYPAMPGDTYHFIIQASDGTTVFDGSFTATAGEVQLFSGYGVTADNMSFRMVRRPSHDNWRWYDVPNSGYTSTYQAGELVSLIVHLNKRYNTSDDIIEALFVVKNEAGEIVCTSSSSASWTYMWQDNYCELDIPTMPTEAGSYTMSIYFNGMAVARTSFTIREG